MLSRNRRPSVLGRRSDSADEGSEGEGSDDDSKDDDSEGDGSDDDDVYRVEAVLDQRTSDEEDRKRMGWALGTALYLVA